MDRIPNLFLKIQDDAKFQQIFQDLIAEFVLDKSRPYLNKYQEIETYAEVLDSQSYIKELAILIAEHNLSTSKQIACASDNLFSFQVPLVIVQLILKKFDEEDQLKINLELMKDELAIFIQKLKAIQNKIQEQDNQGQFEEI
ncbi:hypothetical protein PPERSA_06198 [Pseudocohnilembus persalinus]|uniref:Uncharacterized protein n=1 Tax=Pseudocohnilembus persalinus TaxID=266149 RepID=A0A0V0R0I7_PSEPJ|nr:hypothetical protein PPERSA_06198 [Pseudocohnilembus persalinus]|eukprot:KRX08020.1 hypothetical protein PPERSA_06198 [Pseudocohnilembus persalinus]